MVELDKNPADTVKEHYLVLENTVSSCIEYDACEDRCPFYVPVRERMKRATEIFGN